MTERKYGEEESLERVVNGLVDTALCEIAEKYEDGAFEDQLDYHNTIHTATVMARFELIMRTIALVDSKLASEHMIQVGRGAVSHHDVDLLWSIVDGKRVREMGVSEASSSEKLIRRMRKAGIFSAYDYCIADEGVMVTVPAFDPERKLIYQPNLKQGVSVVSAAIALADLNACGLDGAKVFLRESDKVFIEENVDIARVMKMGGEMEESWKERILKAAEFSLNFAKGRKLCIDDEIGVLPGRVRSIVRELFWGFDESIDAAELQLERRKGMTTEELMDELRQVIK